MKNIFVIVCAVFLLFGDLSADAFRGRRQSCCCQQSSCCQQPARQSCCNSCCQKPARQSCCQASSSCGQASSSCCGCGSTGSVAVASAVESAPVASAAVYEAPVAVEAAPVAVEAAPVSYDAGPAVSYESAPAVSYESAPVAYDAAPAVASDAMFYDGGSNFVESAPMTDMGAADCGCGNQVDVMQYSDTGDMGYMTPQVTPVNEGVISEGGAVSEGVIESPAMDVPAAPMNDSSSYIGAPALQPGEWIVEGSEKVVEAAATAEGVQATPVSLSLIHI